MRTVCGGYRIGITWCITTMWCTILCTTTTLSDMWLAISGITTWPGRVTMTARLGIITAWLGTIIAEWCITDVVLGHMGVTLVGMRITQGIMLSVPGIMLGVLGTTAVVLRII